MKWYVYSCKYNVNTIVIICWHKQIKFYLILEFFSNIFDLRLVHSGSTIVLEYVKVTTVL